MHHLRCIGLKSVERSMKFNFYEGYRDIGTAVATSMQSCLVIGLKLFWITL
jgi:hypothetical protein